MRKSNRANRDTYSREQYSVFDFTRIGMAAVIIIILIGSFMRVVFG